MVCLPGFFCPLGSDVPTACPAGTWSGNSTRAEPDCADCPVGYRCGVPALDWTRHSMVVVDAHGNPIVGSPMPELCEVDETPVHYSFPDHQGCEERCPFQLPRQSFCHIAGDGRMPDKDRAAVSIGELVARSGSSGLTTPSERAQALGNLTLELDNLSEPDRRSALSWPDRNGRTPLIMAAMTGDVPLLEVLWQSGANTTEANAARDLEGFTPLMHALRLGHSAAATWLVAATNASLATADMVVLERFGLDLTGVPSAPFRPAPEYLGGGGLAWTHPTEESFMDTPLGHRWPAG